MTASIWRLSGVMLAVLIGAWLAMPALGARPPLRTAHGEPSDLIPAQSVLVTAAGKLFHRSGCTFVHGPAVTQTGAQAIAGGYTPCTRCLPR